jgi:FkbM family methyltransferase
VPLFSRQLKKIKISLRPLYLLIERSFLGQNVIAILVDTEQGIFLVDREDMVVGRALMKDGVYGKHEIERLGKLIKQSSRVLFVGAHIGSFAIPVSRSVSKVAAIEANPDTFKLLSANIALNKRENIEAISLAASDEKGWIEFILSKHNSGGSKRMPAIKAHMYFYDRPNIIKVPTDKLDDVLSDAYDLIVMDIEGSEYFALKGMTRLLSEANYLVIEFIPHHLRNVANVSVSQFLKAIESSCFGYLYIPSKNLNVEKANFEAILAKMYEHDESDDGIIFSKTNEFSGTLFKQDLSRQPRVGEDLNFKPAVMGGLL